MQALGIQISLSAHDRRWCSIAGFWLSDPNSSPVGDMQQETERLLNISAPASRSSLPSHMSASPLGASVSAQGPCGPQTAQVLPPPRG